jgi:hypothetical protein
VLAAVLLILVVAAVGFEALVSPGTPGPGSDEYAIVVIREGTILARFTVNDLKEIGFVVVVIQGKPQDGPRLLSVLTAAGVDDFDRVRVSGMGVRDSGAITLRRDQISENVVLDLATRGTVKVVGPDIEWEDRVRDVTEIVVE